MPLVAPPSVMSALDDMARAALVKEVAALLEASPMSTLVESRSPLALALALSNSREVLLFQVPASLAPMLVCPPPPRLEAVAVQGSAVQDTIRAIVDGSKRKLKFRLLAKDSNNPDEDLSSTLIVVVGFLATESRRGQLLAYLALAPVLVIDTLENLEWCKSHANPKVLASSSSVAFFLLDERSRLVRKQQLPFTTSVPEKVFRYTTVETPTTGHLVVGDNSIPVDLSQAGWGSRLEALLAARTAAPVSSAPPCSPISSSQAIATAMTIGKLKTLPRTGWVLRGISPCESVADHSHRVGVLALLLAGSEGIDVTRACAMGAVHDLAEALVGDIAPAQGVDDAAKRRLERQAMDCIVAELGDNEASRTLVSLWEEYEARETAEALLVKDLDRFDMALQAYEYERSLDIRLDEFFHSVVGKIRNPQVAQWFESLMATRLQASESSARQMAV